MGFIIFSGEKTFSHSSSVWGPNTTSTWINISRPGWFSWIKTNYIMWFLVSFESIKPNLEYRCLRQSVSTANCTVKVLQKAPATHPLDRSIKHQAWTQMNRWVFHTFYFYGKWPAFGLRFYGADPLLEPLVDIKGTAAVLVLAVKGQSTCVGKKSFKKVSLAAVMCHRSCKVNIGLRCWLRFLNG